VDLTHRDPVLDSELTVVSDREIQGFRRSKVMETAAQLTDVYGPRLTASPQYKKAADWARQQLETWGLANAHLESWPFGRGWSFERCSAHVVSPMSFPLVALPKAWTAGTNGPVRGKVLRVKAESEADVEALKGKVAGMVLWVGQPRELKGPEDGGVFKRYTEKQLDEIEQYQIPGARGGRGPMGPVDREAFIRRRRVQQALDKLYAAEAPLAVVEPSERDANVLRLGGARSYKKGDAQPVTQLVVSASQWNRVARLLDRKMDVEVELDVKAAFHEDDTNGYNVVAELPGSDKAKGEMVMLGAHLDSVIDGPGINDDGSGVAALLEIARALGGTHPQATVRMAFWSGEELGLHGSFRYAAALSAEQARAILVYANVDMIASPNGFAGVYDEPGAPAGSCRRSPSSSSATPSSPSSRRGPAATWCRTCRPRSTARRSPTSPSCPSRTPGSPAR